MIPAAQHEEAVDSGKTVGDTDGADIGIRLGSLGYGITYPSTGFIRRETVHPMECEMEANVFGNHGVVAFGALLCRLRPKQWLLGGVMRFT